MKEEIRRALALAVALSVQWSCGGSSSSTTPTPAATPAPTPQPPVVLFESPFRLPAGFIGPAPQVVVSTSGALTLTVDWTLASNDLDVGLVRGDCTEELFDANQCDFIDFTDSTTIKPAVLSLNVAAGRYTPMIVNFGPGDESGALQVVFAAGATASSASSASTSRPKSPVRFLQRLR